MPLPAPSTERKLHHTRTITCLGYQRADGLWDIDGWLTDVKTAGYPNPDRGEIPAGEPLHGMGIRLTIDATLTIRYAVAVTDFSPFRICPEVTPNFAKLAGLRLTTGYNRAARAVVGGTAGCTHLVELLPDGGREVVRVKLALGVDAQDAAEGIVGVGGAGGRPVGERADEFG